MARLQVLKIMIDRDDMTRVASTCREGELYDPTEITFYYYEGLALFRLGHNREAMEQVQKGVERIDDETDLELASDVYALLGDILYDMRLKDEAYTAYDHALEYNAQNLLCLNNYAYFLSIDGRQLDKAERMSRLTIEAEGDNGTYLDTYAWILYLKHEYAQARIYIEEALRYTPEDAESATTFDHAGDIYFRLNIRSQAIAFGKGYLAHQR